MPKLTVDEVRQRLTEIPGWAVVDGKLRREFEFADFSQAFAFMTRAALYSEKRDHHPEWFNVYNRVRVDLVSHNVKGISDRDIDWAKAANEIYESFPQTGARACCG